jgi:hypothetical protein
LRHIIDWHARLRFQPVPPRIAQLPSSTQSSEEEFRLLL